MLDFVYKGVNRTKNGIEIFPDYQLCQSKDLMVKGSDFYAIWDEKNGIWSTNELTAVRLIDEQLESYAQEYRELGEEPKVLSLRRARTGQIDLFHKYCQKQMRKNWHQLDAKLIFANTETKKEDYASKRLPYNLEKGSTESWDKLLSVLYYPDEQMKIEWCIGAIVSGDSKKIQKFMVLYGDRGTGKSTVIDIIEMLFDGYCASFNARDLGSSSASFSLEPFKDNPLVAIQHDGNLSKIEDNTKLNMLVSHEMQPLNAKYQRIESQKIHTFLILASNDPVMITNSKSGLLRRIIDVVPTGNKIEQEEYFRLKKAVEFELGAIAYKCLDIYKKNKHLYDDYIPMRMMAATNDMYGYMFDNYFRFKNEDAVTLNTVWKDYKEWCEDSNVTAYKKTKFGEELKAYFREFRERDRLEDGSQVWNRYIGFKSEIFNVTKSGKKKTGASNWIQLKAQPSLIDVRYKACKAQYATQDEKPYMAWSSVESHMSDINSSVLHYVRPPATDIVIDFDIRDSNGNKSLAANLKAASAFPMTYAEVSKSGDGLHLHYIYDGDVTKLADEYEEGIEIKKFTGKASLRRKLTLCNDIPVAKISSGLPLKPSKEDNSMADFTGFKSEKALRSMISRNLRKEIDPHTKPSIDYIYNDLKSAYDSGLTYDVSDMRNAIIAFAMNSSNQKEACLQKVYEMPFKSMSNDDESDTVFVSTWADDRIVFFDVEVFPNLFVLCYKFEDAPNVISLINPSPEAVQKILGYKLVGFNNRKYDNHIIYARSMGYSNEALYNLSYSIIHAEKGKRDCFFRDAYGLSYTDIYDFCSEKKSLKKWEIALGIDHVELNMEWDKPVPEERWEEVASYCVNDVLATEATWKKNHGDFIAREILADIAGGCPNDTTNTLTTRFIFGNVKKPQNEFNYYFMGISEEEANDLEKYTVSGLDCDWKYTVFDKNGRAYFPGYEFKKLEKPVVVEEVDENTNEVTAKISKVVSTYRGSVVGEGGMVYANPGMYHNVVTYDVASMHPSSIIAMNLFGKYTKRFADIVQMRIYIKHGDFESAKKMFGGKLAKYLNDPDSAAALSQALKIAINSVYGLTAAKFDNAFRDVRNVDNIVAKRGSLFMKNLIHEVERRGFLVAHVKTDSIKVVDPTPELAQFISDYGKLYGYNFEIEAEYERMCLVNNAVYIARYKKPKKDKKTGKDIWWTATGKEFAVPYVYKTLFSHEDIEWSDCCETFNVKTSLYLTDENDKQFVGRVGQFTPIIGGKDLMRKDDNDKFAYPAGAKGYKWMESAVAKPLVENGEKRIDLSYYEKLVNDARTDISKFGDFEAFVNVA